MIKERLFILSLYKTWGDIKWKDHLSEWKSTSGNTYSLLRNLCGNHCRCYVPQQFFVIGETLGNTIQQKLLKQIFYPCLQNHRPLRCGEKSWWNVYQTLGWKRDRPGLTFLKIYERIPISLYISMIHKKTVLTGLNSEIVLTKFKILSGKDKTIVNKNTS